MNNDKKIIIMLLGLAIGVIGYSYFLTMKIANTENQISELRNAPIKLPEKKINLEVSKFKMLSARYCEPDNQILSITFDEKDQFEYLAAGSEAIKGNYTLDKNTILLKLSKNSQQEFVINTWDNDNNVIGFSSGNQHLSTTVCKTPEQIKQEQEKIEQEKIAKAEQEKLEQEKLAKAEQEKLEKEKIEKERLAKIEQDKIEEEKAAKIKLELEQLAKEKAEKAEQERIEQEKAAKLELERLAKEKTKIDKPITEKTKDETINLTKELPTKVEENKLDPFYEGLDLK